VTNEEETVINLIDSCVGVAVDNLLTSKGVNVNNFLKKYFYILFFMID